MLSPNAEAPPSVGRVLRDHILEIDGITQDKLASALGISRHSVNELLNDRRSITAAMALRLARALATTPQFWLKLQHDVDLARARRELGGDIEKIPVLRAPPSWKEATRDPDSLFEWERG